MLRDKEELKMICLTETQLKTNKIKIHKDIESINSMRERKNTRRGGGLMILYNKNENIKLEKIENTEKEILEVEGKCLELKMKIILVYFDTRKNKEGNMRNKEIREEVEKCINKTEDEALIILGDFNAHIGLLDKQRIDKNGEMLQSWIKENNLVMLKLDDKCEGTYTFERNKSKTAIDYILVNQKMYGKFIEMKIDEDKERCVLSDHNLLTAKFELKGQKKEKKKEKDKEYFTKGKKALSKYRERLEEEWKKNQIKSVSDITKSMKKIAKEVLLRRFKDKGNKKEDKKWINDNIRKEIKKRKELNTAKRNSKMK